MKQFLEVSGIVYDAEANKTRFSLVNYFLHDNGQKEVKTTELAEFPTAGEISHAEVLDYAKGLINPDYAIEVVYSEITTDANEGVQGGTSAPIQKEEVAESTVSEASTADEEVTG